LQTDHEPVAEDHERVVEDHEPVVEEVHPPRKIVLYKGIHQ